MAASSSSTTTTSSTETYNAKIYIFVPDPQSLLDAGYDSIRLERKKKAGQPFVAVTKPEPIFIEAGVYNYFFLDEKAQRGWEYEPVLQNSVTPGTPADVRQGVTDAIDASFEQVCTIQELKDIYLYGLGDALSDDAGVPLPDRVYAHYIRAAIAKFEQKTAIRVLPTKFVEEHDYFEDDVHRHFAFWTHEFPIISVEEIALQLPGQDPSPYPTEWFKVQQLMGQVHMVPDGLNTFSPSQVFGRKLFGVEKWVPNAFKITYFAGFGGGGVPLPANIKDVIGKEASMGPLNIGGDLLGGAGIASQSISLDGLSTNFNTTSSATNAGFGARIIQYGKELKDQYPEIIRYFKGLRMRVV